MVIGNERVDAGFIKATPELRWAFGSATVFVTALGAVATFNFEITECAFWGLHDIAMTTPPPWRVMEAAVLAAGWSFLCLVVLIAALVGLHSVARRHTSAAAQQFRTVRWVWLGTHVLVFIGGLSLAGQSASCESRKAQEERDTFWVVHHRGALYVVLRMAEGKAFARSFDRQGRKLGDTVKVFNLEGLEATQEKLGRFRLDADARPPTWHASPSQ